MYYMYIYACTSSCWVQQVQLLQAKISAITSQLQLQQQKSGTTTTSSTAQTPQSQGNWSGVFESQAPHTQCVYLHYVMSSGYI